MRPVRALISDLSSASSRLSGGDTIVPPQDAQRQLRSRRVDGGTPRQVLGRYSHASRGFKSGRVNPRCTGASFGEQRSAVPRFPL